MQQPVNNIHHTIERVYRHVVEVGRRDTWRYLVSNPGPRLVTGIPVMDTDPGILCFQHCSAKVFCFELPAKCPICGSHLTTAQFRLLPFRYNEETFNCYTFVLTFLRNLCYGNLSKAATSRTVFCENFIVPRTTAAGKYISLYRKLSDMGCYIQRHPAVEVATVTLPNR
ncbi:hypothetical protein Cfor_03243 [Coptotermes formosanus]|uniref:Uncharacterized protein n=1 Tax=Coptotermes formosanus TaxID=36987 RepID=A0A6L2Q167_COPFO|nr:hypothetical protein Cfor_03243 [Coptotermes formosanus]